MYFSPFSVLADFDCYSILDFSLEFFYNLLLDEVEHDFEMFHYVELQLAVTPLDALKWLEYSAGDRTGGLWESMAVFLNITIYMVNYTMQLDYIIELVNGYDESDFDNVYLDDAFVE